MVFFFPERNFVQQVRGAIKQYRDQNYVYAQKRNLSEMYTYQIKVEKHSMAINKPLVTVYF